MALIVEDGTGLVGANTLASRAELIEFGALRGVTVPDADSSDVHLVKAMDALELYDWAGDPTYTDPPQGTFFPRLYLDPRTELEVWPSDEVPAPVKKAQLLLALASFQGTPLLAPTAAGPALKRRKVGPMEREYFDNGAGSTVAIIPGVEEALRPYLAGGGGIALTVKRA